MRVTTKTNENNLSYLFIIICVNSTCINFCVWGCHSLDSFFLWNFVICWKVDKAPTTHASPAKCIPPATLVLSSATCCNLEIPSVTYCTSLHQTGGQCNHLVSTVHPSAPTCTRAHKQLNALVNPNDQSYVFNQWKPRPMHACLWAVWCQYDTCVYIWLLCEESFEP